MKPEVNTRVFEFSHGKKPRGEGYWAFNTQDRLEGAFWFNGSYSEAKKAAQAHFAGEPVVYVLS